MAKPPAQGAGGVEKPAPVKNESIDGRFFTGTEDGRIAAENRSDDAHIDINRYRGIVVAKHLSRVLQKIYQSGKYGVNELRKKLGMTLEEFQILLDGSLVKMRKIKQHTYSPAWVPIESASGEDIKIERPTGHSETV